MQPVKQLAIKTLDRLEIANRLNQHISRDIALLYHSVEDQPSGYPWSVDVRNFAAHMDYLRAYASPVSLDTIFNRPRGGTRVAITFDDAYEELYHYVFPVIVEQAIPITIFVPTAFIDSGYTLMEHEGQTVRKSHLSWAQMREMAASGLVHFESHSHSHLLSTENPDLFRDVSRSVQLISEQLGRRPRYFAYPYGTWNEHTQAAICSVGFARIFGIRSRPISGLEVEGRFDILRRNEDLSYFKLTLAGINSDLVRDVIHTARTYWRRIVNPHGSVALLVAYLVDMSEACAIF